MKYWRIIGTGGAEEPRGVRELPAVPGPVQSGGDLTGGPHATSHSHPQQGQYSVWSSVDSYFPSNFIGIRSVIIRVVDPGRIG